LSLLLYLEYRSEIDKFNKVILNEIYKLNQESSDYFTHPHTHWSQKGNIIREVIDSGIDYGTSPKDYIKLWQMVSQNYDKLYPNNYHGHISNETRIWINYNGYLKMKGVTNDEIKDNKYLNHGYDFVNNVSTRILYDVIYKMIPDYTNKKLLFYDLTKDPLEKEPLEIDINPRMFDQSYYEYINKTYKHPNTVYPEEFINEHHLNDPDDLDELDVPEDLDDTDSEPELEIDNIKEKDESEIPVDVLGEYITNCIHWINYRDYQGPPNDTFDHIKVRFKDISRLHVLLHYPSEIWEIMNTIKPCTFPSDVAFKITNPGEQMTNTFNVIVLKDNKEWYKSDFYKGE